MFAYLQPKSHSAIPTFDLVWCAPLKSEEFSQRRHFAPACRHSPQGYQQIDLIPGPAGRSCKQFAAKAAIETKANGG
jgi:hypothetical protein